MGKGGEEGTGRHATTAGLEVFLGASWAARLFSWNLLGFLLRCHVQLMCEGRLVVELR